MDVPENAFLSVFLRGDRNRIPSRAYEIPCFSKGFFIALICALVVLVLFIATIQSLIHNV